VETANFVGNSTDVAHVYHHLKEAEMDEKVFLVRVGDRFLHGFNSKWQPLCVEVPSAAKHVDYRTGDKLAQVLRAKGFEAYVSNALGQPVTLEVLEAELEQKKKQ
jgi:hypothetical protein